MKSHVIIAVVCLLAGNARLFGQETQKVEYFTANLSLELQQIPPDQLESNVLAVISAQRRLANSIIGQVAGDGLTKDAKAWGIYCLGAMRSPDAVAVLLNQIDFEYRGNDIASRISRWLGYPAQQALVKIGSPAIAPTLSKLAVDDNALRRQLMCSTLIDIDGGAFAKARINAQLEKETDMEKRTRLEKAIADIDIRIKDAARRPATP